jgi:hypothetical protein
MEDVGWIHYCVLRPRRDFPDAQVPPATATVRRPPPQ